ncbi:hypothetical protein B0H14DRAFT_1683408 [Mycena olivaceomarginata]|nr:hypothetical protein B0H14DRAFT_1683408 [Mycena olivaceomarginata]
MSGARGCFNCGGFGHQAAACPRPGRPPATTAASRATSRATAPPRRNPSRATSVAKRDISGSSGGYSSGYGGFRRLLWRRRGRRREDLLHVRWRRPPEP